MYTSPKPSQQIKGYLSTKGVQAQPKLDPNLKMFSPAGAKQYNAGQRGVTSKPFSPEWTNQVDDNIKSVMSGKGYKKHAAIKHKKRKSQSIETIARTEQNAKGKGGKGNFARKLLKHKKMCKKHKRLHCSSC
jgi:hypothetical protein